MIHRCLRDEDCIKKNLLGNFFFIFCEFHFIILIYDWWNEFKWTVRAHTRKLLQARAWSCKEHLINVITARHCCCGPTLRASSLRRRATERHLHIGLGTANVGKFQFEFDSTRTRVGLDHSALCCAAVCSMCTSVALDTRVDRKRTSVP